MQKKKSKTKIKEIRDHSTADAIIPSTKPGFKAGNVLIDENNEMSRRKLQKAKRILKKLGKTF